MQKRLPVVVRRPVMESHFSGGGCHVLHSPPGGVMFSILHQGVVYFLISEGRHTHSVSELLLVALK